MLKQLPYKKLRIIIAFAAAIVITAGAALGAFYYLDNYLSDALYQKQGARDERIAIIGIDAYALEELGPWPWDRSIMADVLETLNEDESARPAVIGVDIVYAGPTDEYEDSRLAEAAAEGNIIFSATVEFTTELIQNADGTAYFSDFEVDSVHAPFEVLKEAAPYGHTNAMYDKDGVLRHHLWAVPDGNGGELLSMPYLVYKSYCESQSIEADFVPKRTDKGFWYIDFEGAPQDYYFCSAADVLYGDYDPDMVADAIVLIGPYEMGLSDQYLTAVDRSMNMNGVEYLANVIDAMLRGREIASANETAQLVVLFAFVALLTLIGGFIAFRWAVPVLLVATAAPLLVGGLLYQAGVLIHPLWFAMGGALALILTVALHYIMSAAEKRRVVKTFERYQDPSVIKELLRYGITDADLRGKIVDIAVLFVDIRGFTPLSERLQPTEVVEILDEYLTLTSHAVMRSGGTLDKFVGDCTMAFWGAPLPCEDKVYKACRAAMDMKEGSQALCDKLKERYGLEVAFGVGVHVGPAVVGNIGSPERKDYTAIGDTVNTAARLESNAPKSTIYISRAVADSLGDRAKVTSLGGSVKLKGKTEGFEVLTLDELYSEEVK